MLGLVLACGTTERRRTAESSDDAELAPSKTDGANPMGIASPKAGYRAFDILGFQVLVNEAVFAQPGDVSKQLLARITTALEECERLMGKATVDRIRAIRIWAEWESHDKTRPRGPAEFHRSREWLSKHGYDPDKVHSVEINDTLGYLKASSTNQPQLILHELVHAYDATVLGSADPEVLAGFDRAAASGRYDRVARIGKAEPERAYALSSKSEFLAELSEAYFGLNDYFPHVREQISAHDPQALPMLERIWGPRPARPSLPLGPCDAATKTELDGRSTAVLIENVGSAPIDVLWRDREGREVPMSTVAPSQQYVQTTFMGHAFVVKANGACVGTFLGANEVSSLRTSAKP